MNLQFDPKTHTYMLDGKRIPGVTQIINELVPMQYKPDDWYLQRGAAVHACAAMIARDIDFEYDERISGQVKAIRKFFAEVNPETIEIEKRVFSKLYRFAGTFDLAAIINRRLCLIDYKGSLSIERTALQLAGYSIASNGIFPGEIHLGIGIVIKEDGSYSTTKPIKLKNYQREFLALRAVYAIRERLNLNKQED